MKAIIERIITENLSVSIQSKVTSVDKSANTCDVSPLDGGAEILDVQLKADDGKSKGQIIYPSTGSVVLVSPLNNSKSNFFVSMFSEVDEISNVIDGTKLVIDKSGFIFEKGNDSMKSLLNDIVDQMLKIYAPKDVPGITRLKVKINNLFK